MDGLSSLPLSKFLGNLHEGAPSLASVWAMLGHGCWGSGVRVQDFTGVERSSKEDTSYCVSTAAQSLVS